MLAKIFLASFLGCLFAMVTVALFAIARFRTFVSKNLGEILANTHRVSDPAQQAEIERETRQFVRGVDMHAASADPVICGDCKRHHDGTSPYGGWSVSSVGWRCPPCTEKAIS
jgi:hypothetical protein